MLIYQQRLQSLEMEAAHLATAVKATSASQVRGLALQSLSMVPAQVAMAVKAVTALLLQMPSLPSLRAQAAVHLAMEVKATTACHHDN